MKGELCSAETTSKTNVDTWACSQSKVLQFLKMAATKFLYPLSEFLGMIGEASDAVSAYTQVKMVVALGALNPPENECPENSD